MVFVIMMNFNKKTIDDLQVEGKRVLVRCDFNVPLSGTEIVDDTRICAALPTIETLIRKKAKIILCSHMGKPKGKPNAALSLDCVAKRLQQKLGKQVVFAADDNVVGPNAQTAVKNMQIGDVVLLQNTRFRAEETKNEENFSKELASLADVFVNDAFGAAHRAHCSTVGVAAFVEQTAIGHLIQKELKFLGKAIENPERPFVNILGGAKVVDKLSVIENLLDKADVLIIGGGMAYTFLKASGFEVGQSIVDETKVDYCKKMLEKAKQRGVEILLPVDNLVVESFPNPIDSEVECCVCATENFGKTGYGVDIGPKTVELYKKAIQRAATVVWNGPMGVFENSSLAGGTKAVAQALAGSSAITIVGGGDSAAAVNLTGVADKITHISTGGGACLEFLEGKVLPGIACIADAD